MTPLEGVENSIEESELARSSTLTLILSSHPLNEHSPKALYHVVQIKKSDQGSFEPFPVSVYVPSFHIQDDHSHSSGQGASLNAL